MCLSMRCRALLSRTSKSSARHRPSLVWMRRQVCLAALTRASGLRANGSGRSLRMKHRDGARRKVARHQGQGLKHQPRRSKTIGLRAARALLECWRRLTLTIHQSAVRSARVRRMALRSGDRTRPRPVRLRRTQIVPMTPRGRGERCTQRCQRSLPSPRRRRRHGAQAARCMRAKTAKVPR